jgi:hypothetical protein
MWPRFRSNQETTTVGGIFVEGTFCRAIFETLIQSPVHCVRVTGNSEVEMEPSREDSWRVETPARPDCHSISR